jgi:hypothetical protein
MRAKIAVLLICTLLATAATAQVQVPAPLQNASPIALASRPERLAPGTSVTVLGTVAQPGSTAVTITIDPPGGARFTTSVSPDANGAFAMQYQDTQRPGTYRVQATSVSGNAATSFEVGFAAVAQNTVRQALEILRAADLLLQQGKRQYAEQVAATGARSAAVDQQLAQLQDVIAAAIAFWTPSGAGRRAASAPSFADGLLFVSAQLQSRPELAPHFAADLNRLRSWSEQADANLKRLKSREPALQAARSMNQPSLMLEKLLDLVIAPAAAEGMGNGCKTSKRDAEMFEEAGSLLSLIGPPFIVGLNLITQGLGALFGHDTFAPIAEHAGLGAYEVAEYQHEAAEWQHVAASASGGAGTAAHAPSMLGPGMTFLTLGTHLFAVLAETVLQAECDVWQGKFTATMHAEAENEGVPWWRYSVKIAGTLTLYLKKKSNAASVPLFGEFEGNGTDFTVWEDALPVLYGPYVRQGTAISFHKVSATRVTNLAGCTSCVFPGHRVATATATEKDLSPSSLPTDPWAGSLVSPQAEGVTPGPVSFLSCNPAPDARSAPPEAPTTGVSGQPTNLAQYLAPGLQNSTPGLNIFSPAYFRVPVEGAMQTDVTRINRKYQQAITVSLKVKEAENDWDPKLINAHVVYLVIPVLLAPKSTILMDFGLPYKSAEFILKRALGDTDKSKEDGNLAEFETTLKQIFTSGEAQFSDITLHFRHKNVIPTNPVPGSATQTGRADYCINMSVEKE